MVPKEEKGRRGNRSSGDPDGRAASSQREYVGAGFIGGVVVLILLGLLLVALIAQNADPVRFSLLWWEADIALAALLLGSAVLAVLVSELIGMIWRRRRRTYRRLQESKAG